jgi:opacity protein-like surface antigen
MKLRTVVFCVATVGSAFAAPLVFDAGASYVLLTGARYETDPDPSIAHEDKTAWSPYVGAAWGFSAAFAIRLGYQFIGNLRTDAVYSMPPGPGPVKPAVVVPAKYKSDIHDFTVGPQFRINLDDRFSALLTPELNWVLERGDATYFSGPAIAHDQNKLTLGASAALRYTIDSRWSVDLTYRYIDASPSWHRKAHAFGVGLSFR